MYHYTRALFFHEVFKNIMSKTDFKDYVCRPYCLFFKEGQKEEMACRGAEVIEKMVMHQLIDPDKLPRFEKNGRLWQNYKKIFGKYICATCPFRIKDCDFMSEAPEKAAGKMIEPCGGFILLALLIENDFIDMTGLEQVL
jgi:hypothetical protein